MRLDLNYLELTFINVLLAFIVIVLINELGNFLNELSVFKICIVDLLAEKVVSDDFVEDIV